jgi:hypothetical protein
VNLFTFERSEVGINVGIAIVACVFVIAALFIGGCTGFLIWSGPYLSCVLLFEHTNLQFDNGLLWCFYIGLAIDAALYTLLGIGARKMIISLVRRTGF